MLAIGTYTRLRKVRFAPSFRRIKGEQIPRQVQPLSSPVTFITIKAPFPTSLTGWMGCDYSFAIGCGNPTR